MNTSLNRSLPFSIGRMLHVIALFTASAWLLALAPDSVAYEAGLRAGAVIQEINKKPVRNAEDAVGATRHVPGKRVLLQVWSQDSSRFLVVDEGKER